MINTRTELCAFLDNLVLLPDLQPRNGTTYCNLAAARILLNGYGSDIFMRKGQPITANAIDAILRTSTNFKTLELDEAIHEALFGRLVFASEKGAEHGHVCALYPDSPKASGSWGRDVPMVANVGKRNGIMKLSEAFRPSPGIHYAQFIP